MHTTSSEDGQPVCYCGARCWGYGLKSDEPCWGDMRMSEDYPDSYTHFCDGHGHPEDHEPYRKKPDDPAKES